MMQYWTAILTEAAIFSILALGIDMIWGWAGDFDLSAYAYFALGVYMTIVLTVGKPVAPVTYIFGVHWPYPLAVIAAVVTVVAFASVIGAVALRNLREVYFSITTLGAVWAIYYWVENFTPLFNGYNGVYGLFDPMGGGLSYNAYHYLFFAGCLIVLFGAYLLVSRLSRSPFGRTVRAVRDDEAAARVYGRNVFWAKYRTYLFGAGLAGFSGSLFAAYIGAFNPLDWRPTEIFVLYAAILVGGRGNPRGVILGSFIVYVGFVELTRYIPSPAARPELGPALRQILIGLLIILMLKFRPSGLIPERLGTDGAAEKRRWRQLLSRASHTEVGEDVGTEKSAVTTPVAAGGDA
ncbi:MAG: branched-chain amino acid ABC transporter permease [Acidobacteriota bacterium]|nr:branched-chain amino acid ABC transporter permease [Acidobacteriota bacterium]